MVSLICETTREDGVTLVTAQVTNSGRRRRVRLEHDADGAVWPPRTEGVPAAGWDGTTFECVLAADERRALGYATPAAVEDPLTVAATEPVDAEPTESATSTDGVPAVDDSPAGVIRALGSPVPPRDAVPDADPPATAPTEGAGAPAEAVDADATATDATGTGITAVEAAGADADPATEDVDAPAEEWFTATERRIAAAEDLSGDTTVRAATPTVREFGGLAGVRDASATLDAEADRLRAVAERATALADRAEAVTLPVETLERLA
jgi:hypothetical protein